MPNTEIIKKVDTMWDKAIMMSESFVSKKELIELPKGTVVEMEEKFTTTMPMSIYSFNRLVYDPEEGIVDKLVNVYASIHSMDASLYIIIRGHKHKGTELYIGSRSRKNTKATSAMMQKSFEGNFPGIDLELLDDEHKEELLDECFPKEYSRKYLVSLSVSPDCRMERTERRAISYIQGLEKFIDTMKGQEYTAFFLAEPLEKEDCQERRKSYEKMISELSKCNKMSVGYTESNSIAVNESLSDGVSENITESISHSVSTNTSRSIGKTKGYNSGHGSSFFGFSMNGGRSRAITKTQSDGMTEGDTDTSATAHGTTNTKTVGKSIIFFSLIKSGMFFNATCLVKSSTKSCSCTNTNAHS